MTLSETRFVRIVYSFIITIVKPHFNMKRKIFIVSSTIGEAAYLVYTTDEKQAKQIVIKERRFDYEDLHCNEFYLPEDESVSIESLGF